MSNMYTWYPGQTVSEDLSPSMWELIEMMQNMPSEGLPSGSGIGSAIGEGYQFEDKLSQYMMGLMERSGLVSEDVMGGLGSMVQDWYGKYQAADYWPEKVRLWDEFSSRQGEMVSGTQALFEALEEGRQSLESRDKGFGLKRKIGSIEGGAETAIESSIQDYIPTETLTRYGGLQGKGSTIAGELAEADYLSRQSEIGRMEAGKKRGTYREYGSEMFDALSRWLQGISG